MSKRLTDEQADEVIKNLDLKVGVGDPSSPFFGDVLSIEDEQKLDHKGELIVSKAPWSRVPTGLYLTVAASLELGAIPQGAVLGGYPVPVALSAVPMVLYVITTNGKPTFHKPVAGAALEIPSDLGQDALKRKYVVEWLRDTAAESLALLGVSLVGKQAQYVSLGAAVAVAAEEAIGRTGL